MELRKIADTLTEAKAVKEKATVYARYLFSDKDVSECILSYADKFANDIRGLTLWSEGDDTCHEVLNHNKDAEFSYFLCNYNNKKTVIIIESNKEVL